MKRTRQHEGRFGARLATRPKGANQHSSIELSSITQEQAEKLLNVGVASIKRARVVLDSKVCKAKSADMKACNGFAIVNCWTWPGFITSALFRIISKRDNPCFDDFKWRFIKCCITLAECRSETDRPSIAVAPDDVVDIVKSRNQVEVIFSIRICW